MKEWLISIVQCTGIIVGVLGIMGLIGLGIIGLQQFDWPNWAPSILLAGCGLLIGSLIVTMYTDYHHDRMRRKRRGLTWRDE